MKTRDKKPRRIPRRILVTIGEELKEVEYHFKGFADFGTESMVEDSNEGIEPEVIETIEPEEVEAVELPTIHRKAEDQAEHQDEDEDDYDDEDYDPYPTFSAEEVEVSIDV